jgi:hypothetical protein
MRFLTAIAAILTSSCCVPMSKPAAAGCAERRGALQPFA